MDQTSTPLIGQGHAGSAWESSVRCTLSVPRNDVSKICLDTFVLVISFFSNGGSTSVDSGHLNRTEVDISNFGNRGRAGHDRGELEVS